MPLTTLPHDEVHRWILEVRADGMDAAFFPATLPNILRKSESEADQN